MLTSSPPPATRDSLPSDTALRRRLEARFARTAEAYGFKEVATPMFERADLFAARSGPEIKNALLTFHCDHEEYALRPEMTAPICRLVASGALQDLPRPYKLFYVAPCFRYCRPHSGRVREFVQAGIELLGEAGPQADAEVIAAACRFLRSNGIEDYSLKIGTAGIFRALLPDDLGADDRAAVIGHLDRLAGIDERCATLADGRSPLVLEQLRADRRELASLQVQDGYGGPFAIADRPKPDLEELVRLLPQEAAATFRHLWNIEGYLPDETAELLIRTSRIRGTLEQVSADAAEVLDGTRAREALGRLLAVCRLLRSYGLAGFEVVLGIARGLTFYTGPVFEIARGARKLCGGGRYDRLVELFGGEPMPATGCAVRFDTLEDLVRQEDAAGAVPDFALAPATPDDEADAVALAEELRDCGIRVGAAGAPVAAVRAGRVQLPGGTDVPAQASAVLEALAANPGAPQVEAP